MDEREHREFRYSNSDGDEGFVEIGFGPWGWTTPGADNTAPIMVSFDDAGWMGIEEAEAFLRWLKVALPEAKRRHPFSS